MRSRRDCEMTHMTSDEVRQHLEYLVKKYIQDGIVLEEQLALIHREDGPPVKAIMSVVTSGVAVDTVDSELIKSIAFHFL